VKFQDAVTPPLRTLACLAVTAKNENDKK